MERTAEFRALVAQLPKPPIAPPPSSGPKPSAQATAQFLASFHTSAAHVSKKIHDTSQKLSQLSKLVQRKSMFDDPAEEINGLMYSIKEDIQTLNSMLEDTQRDVDDFKYRQKDHAQLASHSSHVVGTLRGDLADATRQFKTLLQQRSSNVKEQFDRRGQYGIRANDVLALGKPVVYRPMSETARGPPTAQGGLALPRPPGVGEPPTPPSAGGLQMTRYQQQQVLIPEQSYLEARAQAIEDVETHIVELGNIFNRLAHMIAEQRELVERIEDNVDDAHTRVSGARDYLLSVYSSLNSNRPLVIKSALVLLVFIVIFVLFIA